MVEHGKYPLKIQTLTLFTISLSSFNSSDLPSLFIFLSCIQIRTEFCLNLSFSHIYIILEVQDAQMTF